MVYEKLNIIITLVAALTVTIVSLYIGDSFFVFALKLVVTIAVFFAVGSVIKAYISSRLAVNKEPEAAEVDKEAEEPEQDE